MISPLQVSVSVVRLLFQQFILYTVFGNDLRVVHTRVQGSNCPLFMCAHMLPPVSVAHHNRESVDYIADTTLRSLFVRVTYLLVVPLSNSCAVVINSRQPASCDGAS